MHTILHLYILDDKFKHFAYTLQFILFAIYIIIKINLHTHYAR